MDKPKKQLIITIHGIRTYGRAKRGLSQEKLALEAGVNRTYLSAVERSEQNISVDNIAKIAKALNVPVWTLLKG